MPFRLSHDDGIVTATFFGAVTDTDLVAIASELATLEQAQTAPPSRLTDLSGTTAMNIDFAAMAAFAERRRRQKFTRPFKSAIVAPTPVQFGLGRMFQILNDHPQIEIRVFRDATEAWAWVRSAD